MNRRAARRGFTLLEMVLAMGLAFFLMGALYQAIDLQAKYAEVSERSSREPLLARAILHQIAREVREVYAPAARDLRGAPAARRLLSLAAPTLDNTQAAMEMPLEAGLEPGGLDATLPSAERFALIGEPSRLVFMTRSGHPVEIVDPKAPAADPLNEDAEATPTVPLASTESRQFTSEQRQVLYCLKPIPVEKDKPVAEATDSPTDAEPDAPRFRGLIRQESTLPFAASAQREALDQLQKLVAPAEDETGQSPGAPTGGLESEALIPTVETEVLAEEVTAIRFRYHDGSGWRNRWDRDAEPPVAIEIALSFSDEARVEETLDLAPMEGELVPGPLPTELETPETTTGVAETEEFSEPTFPYRLVVAIPSARRPAKTLIVLEDAPADQPPGADPFAAPPPPGGAP